MSKGIDLFSRLREYQKEAVNAFISSEQGIVEMPTGAGKTYVAIAAILELLRSGKIENYIVTVPTIALAFQWYRELNKAGLHPTFIPREPNVSNIMTYPGFIKYTDSTTKVITLIPRKETMLVIDEAHHIHKGTKLYEAVAKFPAKYKLGLSATLTTGHQYPMNTVYKITTQEILKYTPKVKLHIVQVTPTPAFYQMYNRYTTNIINLISELDQISNLKEGARIEAQISRLISLRHTLMALDPHVLKATVDVSKTLCGKQIIFTLRLSAIRKLESELMKYGSVYSVLGKQSAKRLSQLNVDRIIAAKALSEGIDLPEVDVVILSSYPRRLRTLIQEVGRAMRGSTEKTVMIYMVAIPRTYEIMAAKELSAFLGVTPVVEKY